MFVWYWELRTIFSSSQSLKKFFDLKKAYCAVYTTKTENKFILRYKSKEIAEFSQGTVPSAKWTGSSKIPKMTTLRNSKGLTRLSDESFLELLAFCRCSCDISRHGQPTCLAFMPYLSKYYLITIMSWSPIT